MRDWFSFQGRIGRGTFWLRYLVLLVLVLALYAGIILMAEEGKRGGSDIFILLILALLVPMIVATVAVIATVVKRLHDWNQSGWLFLITIIPIVGLIWLIVLGAKEGTPGPNKYGPQP